MINIIEYATQILNENQIEYSLTPTKGDGGCYHYLYCVKNKTNNKIYIGIHSHSQPFDDKYYGSGNLIKKEVKKLGRENFDKFAIAYFKNLVTLETSERLVVNRQVLEEYSNELYNKRVGGLLVRTNDDSDEEAILKETNRIKASKQTTAKPIIVIDKTINKEFYFESLSDGERYFGFSLRSLIRKSTKSKKSSQYEVHYVNEKDIKNVKCVEYKIPDHSAQEKPITAFDPFGNVVRNYRSTSEAIRELNLSCDFVFKTAIEKHYFVRNCFWDYTNEEDRQNCNYQSQTKQRMIFACDENWEPVEFYVCMNDACRKYGFDKATLKRAIKKQTNLRSRFWKWANEQSENYNYIPKISQLGLFKKKVGGSIEKNGEIAIEFDSAQEASKALNKCPSSVSTSIRTGWRCGGYYWRFIE